MLGALETELGVDDLVPQRTLGDALHRQIQPRRDLEPVVAKDDSHQIMRKNLWPKGSQRDGSLPLGQASTSIRSILTARIR